MKVLGFFGFVLVLTSCATPAKPTAAECAAKYDALRVKAEQAWAQTDHSDKDAMAKAAEVAAQSAQDAVDLSSGACKQFDQSKPGKALKM